MACAQVLSKDEFQARMLEKLIWISAIMLVGAKHKANVGAVESQHTDEVRHGMTMAFQCQVSIIGPGTIDPKLLPPAGENWLIMPVWPSRQTKPLSPQASTAVGYVHLPSMWLLITCLRQHDIPCRWAG